MVWRETQTGRPYLVAIWPCLSQIFAKLDNVSPCSVSQPQLRAGFARLGIPTWKLFMTDWGLPHRLSPVCIGPNSNPPVAGTRNLPHNAEISTSIGASLPRFLHTKVGSVVPCEVPSASCKEERGTAYLQMYFSEPSDVRYIHITLFPAVSSLATRLLLDHARLAACSSGCRPTCSSTQKCHWQWTCRASSVCNIGIQSGRRCQH